MGTLIETSIEAGAHFRRREEGRAPVFVSARREPSLDREVPDDGAHREPTAAAADARAPTPDDAGAAHGAEVHRGRRLYRSGRFRELADFAEELERDARSRGDDGGRALARLLSGRAALEQGRLSFARMRFASLDDISLPPPGRALPLLRAGQVGLGRVALAEGAPERALTLFDGALSGPGAREEDDPALIAARRGLGDAYARMGCAVSAGTEYRKALRRATAHDDRLETSLALSALARAEAGRRESGPDRRLARLARTAAERTASPLATIEAHRARAAVGVSDGRRPQLRRALHELRKALAVALETGSVLRQARVERDAAAVLDALGRPGDAEDRRARARDLLDRGRT